MSDEKDESGEITDDVVVDIAPDVKHIESPHVNEWLKADDNGFRPTPQQEKFRQLAYRMALRKATKAKEYQGTPISERTWARWCKEDDRFMAWFYDEFPDTAELSEEEFKMMDMQYWTGVRDAMTEGEEWAYRP